MNSIGKNAILIPTLENDDTIKNNIFQAPAPHRALKSKFDDEKQIQIFLKIAQNPWGGTLYPFSKGVIFYVFDPKSININHIW